MINSRDAACAAAAEVEIAVGTGDADELKQALRHLREMLDWRASDKPLEMALHKLSNEALRSMLDLAIRQLREAPLPPNEA